MRKFSLELPKFRLELHAKLVKRRKPLVSEPIIPSIETVQKKYRGGTLIGKFVRHISGHKNARKFFAGNLAAFVVTASFLPGGSVKAFDPSVSDEAIIQTQTTLATEKSVQFPLETIKINQGFSFFHPGVDLGADLGDPVRPIKPGVVVEADYTRDGYGNTVLIDHGGGLSSRYAHLSKIEVETGQGVNMSTEIGRVGVTGNSTGPHLHLEIRQNGFPLNPLSVLPR